MLAAVLWQPVCSRAWQRSQIPWPGPRPQVHLCIPGAVTLIPAFHRARAATRHQIKNKWQTDTHILFSRQMQTKMFCFCNHKILPFAKNSLHLLWHSLFSCLLTLLLCFMLLQTFLQHAPEKKAGTKHIHTKALAPWRQVRCMYWYFEDMHEEKPRWTGVISDSIRTLLSSPELPVI